MSVPLSSKFSEAGTNEFMINSAMLFCGTSKNAFHVSDVKEAKSKCSGAFPDNVRRLHAGSDLCRRIESHQTVISSPFHFDTFLSD